MQELVINGLLTVVILTAVILRFFIGTRADSGMTKKQKVMLSPAGCETKNIRAIPSARKLLQPDFHTSA